jgi:hypothetical protein
MHRPVLSWVLWGRDGHGGDPRFEGFGRDARRKANAVQTTPPQAVVSGASHTPSQDWFRAMSFWVVDAIGCVRYVPPCHPSLRPTSLSRRLCLASLPPCLPVCLSALKIAVIACVFALASVSGAASSRS